jgi:hypothetical protein
MLCSVIRHFFEGLLRRCGVRSEPPGGTPAKPQEIVDDGCMSHVGQWGVCGWFPDSYVHPDDLAVLEPLLRRGARLFLCVDENENYLTVQYDNHCGRIRPSEFCPHSTPLHRIGESVVVRRKEGLRRARICEIFWHHNRACPYYNVAIDGRRSGQWFFDKDILSSEEGNVAD